MMKGAGHTCGLRVTGSVLVGDGNLAARERGAAVYWGRGPYIVGDVSPPLDPPFLPVSLVVS